MPSIAMEDTYSWYWPSLDVDRNPPSAMTFIPLAGRNRRDIAFPLNITHFRADCSSFSSEIVVTGWIKLIIADLALGRPPAASIGSSSSLPADVFALIWVIGQNRSEPYHPSVKSLCQAPPRPWHCPLKTVAGQKWDQSGAVSSRSMELEATPPEKTTFNPGYRSIACRAPAYYRAQQRTAARTPPSPQGQPQAAWILLHLILHAGKGKFAASLHFDLEDTSFSRRLPRSGLSSCFPAGNGSSQQLPRPVDQLTGGNVRGPADAGALHILCPPALPAATPVVPPDRCQAKMRLSPS